MLNLANPAAAFRWWRLPADGVGLARMEFVVNNAVKVHPMALVRFDELEDEEAKAEIEILTAGYADRTDYFVDELARGLSRIAAVMYPKPVIVRMSDFKTNEYAELLGGRQFEPKEENPMIGFRGASRYYSDAYRAGFALECRAIRRLREEMGFDNVVDDDPVLPHDRRGRPRARGHGRKRPAARRERPAGLRDVRDPLERDSRRSRSPSVSTASPSARTTSPSSPSASTAIPSSLAALFDERDPAVRWMIETVIDRAHAAGSKVGFCGQAPSNDPAFAKLLVDAGIDSISVTPDSFIRVKQQVAAAEKG